jgi:signal transduction histidine kinase
MAASPDLRILLLEDIPEEAEIVERELRKAGLAFTAVRVQTKPQFIDALERFAPQLILADSKLPGFDGRSALELVKQSSPDVPVIIVTGELGDEAAVALLIAGARDYVLKDRLARLGEAIRRVLREEEARRERERLEDALRKAAEAERRRLARDLHDGLGQELTGLAMLAEGLVMQARHDGAPVPAEIDRLAQIARHAIKSCHDIAHGLSALGGMLGGLTEALRGLVARLGGPPGPRITLTLALRSAITIPREASEHLFRIAQEALANAVKHSGAQRVEVRFEADPQSVRLVVLDDGSGPPADATGSAGLGLRTMHSRAEAIGASLSIAARNGGGTILICEAPQGSPASIRVL